MLNKDIESRFKFYPAKTHEVQALHRKVRALALSAAQIADDFLPEGREKYLAFTHLEEFMFWANAAIARNLSDVEDDGGKKCC